MRSLRIRLFVLLLAATSIIWSSAVAWIYFQSRAELERVMDTRLEEAARMVSSLVGDRNRLASTQAQPPDLLNYDRQLSCQIWSFGGRLIARSSGAPEARLSTAKNGFSEAMVDGEPWRVYVVENAATGTRVMVGDRIGLRDRLIDDLIMALVTPAIFIVPALGLLIWLSLGRGLNPLFRMAQLLTDRSPEDMTPIQYNDAPQELRPLHGAINALLAKLDTARQHEREFTSFAAHELRTPIAGLRTQAQIAMTATEPDIVKSALTQILVSVDRSARLIKQLLTLARLDAGAPERGAASAIGCLIKDVVRDVGDRAGSVETTIDPELFVQRVHIEVEMVTLALRNLQENAVNNSPVGGNIHWGLGPERDTIRILDEGPGVASEDLPHLGKRFFRGKTSVPQGSGLGLAIARTALSKIGAELQFSNRRDRSGLVVEIAFSRHDDGPS